MVRKIISWGIKAVALLALFGGVSVNARGQSCVVTLSDVTDVPLLGGAAAIGTIKGGGTGFSVGPGPVGYNAATADV